MTSNLYLALFGNYKYEIFIIVNYFKIVCLKIIILDKKNLFPYNFTIDLIKSIKSHHFRFIILVKNHSLRNFRTIFF